jgi:hypothetical protein
MITDESILGVIQVNVALAFRTCQNFQQFLADGHWVLLYLRKQHKAISKQARKNKASAGKKTPTFNSFSIHQI